MPQRSGKSYTFTKTKISPAKQYANKYSKPVFMNYYTNLLNNNINKQYQKDISEGEQTINPKNDPILQERIKVASILYAQQDIISLVNLFNTGNYK